MTKQQLIENVVAKTELGKAEARRKTGCELQAQQGINGKTGAARNGSYTGGSMMPLETSGRVASAELQLGTMVRVGGAVWLR